MELRDYQRDMIERSRSAFAAGSRAPLIVVPTGGGKCLGIGTPVLRHDGRIAPVEAIRPGDLLMGPDSTVRNVLSTCRDTGPLYQITPIKGESWVCNDAHVLSLKNTTTGQVVDIAVEDYLHTTKNFRHLHKQFAVGVDFDPLDRELPIDPYFLGVWFGDGSKGLAPRGLRNIAVTKPDAEIVQVCTEMAEQYGCRVRTDGPNNGRCPTHHLAGRHGGVVDGRNDLLDEMRRVLGPKLRVPHAYLVASREARAQFLAGWLDTDGSLSRGGYDFIQRRRDYSEAVCFLARSLGLRAPLSTKYVQGVEYYRVSISGDCSFLPLRIPRKQAPKRRQIKDVLRTGFSVTPAGRGEYAGFELDGDGRFLLGDFTVTHNTVIGSYATGHAVKKGLRGLWLAHRRELIDQAAQRMVVPTGVIMAGRPVTPDAPMQVASVDTLQATGDRPPADLIIVDEGHHATANKIKTLLEMYPNARTLGLTATPQRSDGTALGDVFDALIEGPTIRHLMDQGHLVDCDVVGPESNAKALAMDPAQAWLQYAEGRPGFVFARTVKQSKEITAELMAAGVLAAHVDGTTAKGARDRTIELFRRGQLDVLSSVGVFTEGTDLPRATVCLLARGSSHVGTYLQMVGRVLRPSPGKGRALLIDLLGVVHKHGLPDDPRIWSLDGKACRDPEELVPSLSQCLRCAGVWRSGRRDCPRCGWEMPAPAELKIKERELMDLRSRMRPHVAGLRPGATDTDKATKLARLQATAAERGYKAGWVNFRFKATFGHWPARNV